MAKKNFYQLLHLSDEADTEEIRQAIHQAEHVGNINRRLLKDISETLLNPELRALYDIRLNNARQRGSYFRSPVKWTCHQWKCISVCLWLIALCAPTVLSTSSASKSGLIYNIGIIVLFFGWLQSLAWYANLFIFYAWRRLSNPRQNAPLFSVFVASILALDTFRLEGLYEQGAIIGYGIGFVLWLLSISVLWIATGYRLKELNQSPNNFLLGVILYRSGLGITVLLLVGAIILKVIDGPGASHWEQSQRLWVVYKSGPVCQRAPSYSPLATPVKINGILEVFSKIPSVVSKDFELDPAILAMSGVPVVRQDGFDYRLIHDGQRRIVVKTPASSDVADATLYACQGGPDCVPLRNNPPDTGLGMSLHLRKELQLPFLYTWSSFGGRCSPFGGPDAGQPKKLLQSALGISFVDPKTFWVEQKNLVCLVQPASIHEEPYDGIAPKSCEERVSFYFDLNREGSVTTACHNDYYAVKRFYKPQSMYVQKILRENFHTAWRINIPLEKDLIGYAPSIQVEENKDQLIIKVFDHHKKKVFIFHINQSEINKNCEEMMI